MGEPPLHHLILKAAKTLNCSFLEVFNHPERDQLLMIAFANDEGISSGEYKREFNPTWIRQRKEASEKLREVQDDG